MINYFKGLLVVIFKFNFKDEWVNEEYTVQGNAYIKNITVKF